MADEIRVVPEGMEADDPEFARAQIANTRARMSGTIDEIEDVLLRRKERIQHRLDPFSAVRERPWQATGIVFGAGLVLGLLTGGDDDDEDDDYEYDIHTDFDFDGSTSLDAEHRARKWESRARHLMNLAREAPAAAAYGYDQAREYAHDHVDDDSYEEWDDEDDTSALNSLRDAVAERAAPLIRGLFRQFVGGNRSS